MPVIFAANGSNRSLREQYYADELEQHYEFPSKYRNRITEGDVFIYYRGIKSVGGAGYFGAGVVGPIHDSPTQGRLICEVLDVVFFSTPVPIRDPQSDDYFEEPGQNRINFQQGVRVIPEDTAIRLLDLGLGELLLPDAAPAAEMEAAQPPAPPFGNGYAGQELIDAVFRYSTDVVLDILREKYPTATVTEMPRNNPGYDIRVIGGGPQYVEVKGTTLNAVEFFLKEGERQFSESLADDYVLYVVYGIDLEESTHEVEHFLGAVASPQFSLAPLEYRVRLHGG